MIGKQNSMINQPACYWRRATVCANCVVRVVINDARFSSEVVLYFGNLV